MNINNLSINENEKGIVVRVACCSDLRKIVELKQSLDIEDGIPMPQDELHSTLHRHLFGERPTFEAIVAEHLSEIVGMSFFCSKYYTSIPKPAIYMQDLFVQPDHRRRGIAQLLLRAIADRALALESPHIELHVRSNNAARKFYEANGLSPALDAIVYTGGVQAMRLLLKRPHKMSAVAD